MGQDLSLGRFVTNLRLAGHDFDAIALTLASGAVDALVAGGFRGAALDGGVRTVIDSMWEHVADLRGRSRLAEPPRVAMRRPDLTLLPGMKP